VLVGVWWSTIHKGNPIPVRRKHRFGDLLSVVFVIASQLSAFERRGVGDPNVSLALIVEHPGNLIALRRRDEIAWKWHSENMFEGETVAQNGFRRQQEAAERE